jgi:solute carrier family 7 (L-type amino acid transporter), member 6
VSKVIRCQKPLYLIFIFLTRYSAVASEIEEHEQNDRSAIIHSLEPLEPNETNANDHQIETKGHLTYLNGLAIVIGMMIGAGIFSVPAQVSQHVLSPGLGIISWILAAIIVWIGASVFIELGLNIPLNGGIQEYLRHCYGELLGCLFTWTWVFISKPSSMAIVLRVMAEHFCQAILPDEMISIGLIKLVAFLGFWGITIVNCIGSRSGVQVAMGFLVLKIVAVIAVSAIGLTVGFSGHGNGVKSGEGHGWFDSVADGNLSDLSFWGLSGHFVTALFGSLYCFSGWESVSGIFLVIFFVICEDSNTINQYRSVL